MIPQNILNVLITVLAIKLIIQKQQHFLHVTVNGDSVYSKLQERRNARQRRFEGRIDKKLSVLTFLPSLEAFGAGQRRL